MAYLCSTLSEGTTRSRSTCTSRLTGGTTTPLFTRGSTVSLLTLITSLTFGTLCMLENAEVDRQCVTPRPVDRLKKRACNSNIPLYTQQNSNTIVIDTIFSNFSWFSSNDTVTIFKHSLNFGRCTCPLL